ncbi:hypothetical protein TWF481_007757 [Arthrobotrys musiformis]|uniref:Exonuclease domain-containing protein n=1 Tax=Arthrobotrys musiformis TaxID=47236 RepID=A0AAV9WCK5_9PEZI
MATNRFDQPELIKLTLVDFFTQEVLVDALVKPQAKIKNMVTHIHGITYKNIASALNASTALLGRDAARRKIFEFVGPETMVFVHGGRGDFLCLRWLHPAIVDTQEIESRVKRIGDDELDDWLDDEGTGLEAMCRLITGIQIRSGRTKYGNGVHDSLEDALACRELGIWYAKNLKEDATIKETIKETDQGKEEERAPFARKPVVVVSKAIAAGAVPKVQTAPDGSSLTNPPEPNHNPSSLTPDEHDRQVWNCKVCNLEIPKASEQLHRKERAHVATLITLIQQKGG